MDAEKMAREWLAELKLSSNMVLPPNFQFTLGDDIIGDLSALLTTAHNTGLERAAEIAEAHAQFGAPDTNDAEFIAQAIRREIKR